mmetsp:Transcript_44830/g.50277  ORF Transcript_44830/g.50277 Transcript_44830/m.50277 type:complete len:99 (+) Transcript_44830:1233-1529(+)
MTSGGLSGPEENDSWTTSYSQRLGNTSRGNATVFGRAAATRMLSKRRRFLSRRRKRNPGRKLRAVAETTPAKTMKKNPTITGQSFANTEGVTVLPIPE